MSISVIGSRRRVRGATLAAQLQSSLGDVNINNLWIIGAQTSTSGGVIDSVADARGVGGNIASGVTTTRPAYVESGINGKPIARFDAVDDFLSIASISAALGARTYIAVYNPGATTGIWQSLFDVQTGRQSLEARVFAALTKIGFGDGVSDVAVADATTGAQIVSWEFNGATVTVYRNGVSLGTGVAAADRALGASAAIGAVYPGSGAFFSGDLGTLCIVNGINAGRHSAEVVLGSYYGISVT